MITGISRYFFDFSTHEISITSKSVGTPRPDSPKNERRRRLPSRPQNNNGCRPQGRHPFYLLNILNYTGRIQMRLGASGSRRQSFLYRFGASPGASSTFNSSSHFPPARAYSAGVSAGAAAASLALPATRELTMKSRQMALS